jgi:hypothetical protein
MWGTSNLLRPPPLASIQMVPMKIRSSCPVLITSVLCNLGCP